MIRDVILDIKQRQNTENWSKISSVIMIFWVLAKELFVWVKWKWYMCLYETRNALFYKCFRGVRFLQILRMLHVDRQGGTWYAFVILIVLSNFSKKRVMFQAPTRLCGIHSQTRADYYSVHWIPWPDIFVVFCVFGRKRSNKSWWEDGFHQLRRCALVGSSKLFL